MGRKISYSELDRAANQTADGLRRIGVQPGDKVALLLPNIPQIVMAYFGLWRLGAIPVPHNPLYTDRELEYQLNDSGCTAALSLDLLMPRLTALREKTGLRRIVSCHINDYLPFPIKQLFPIIKKAMHRKFEPGTDLYEFRSVIESGDPTFTGSPAGLDDICLIPYTGGTTGTSKGVVLTHRNASCICQQMKAWFFDWQDRPMTELGIFPLFSPGRVHRGHEPFRGQRLDRGPGAQARTSAGPPGHNQVQNQCRAGRADHLRGSDGAARVQESGYFVCRRLFFGAAPLPLDVIESLKKAAGADIVEGWGMTESTALVTVTPWRGKLKPGSVGVPLPDTEVRVVDLETGTKDMAVGEEGELIFRGPQRCQEYYNNEAETANSIRDGWFYTGDIGRMDEEGFFYIVDRKKDMVIAGGFNIFPREIDEVLFEHPDVVEACAAGVPHEYRGETIKAFVVARPGSGLTAEKLDAFCRERLTPYKVPKLYEFMEELPKSAIGKVLRRELREMETARSGKKG